MTVSNYLQWQKAMLRGADIGHQAKATLAALATWADNETLECFHTQEALADELGLTPRTVRAHLAEAIAAGWLVKARKGAPGRATDYQLAYGRRKPVSGDHRKSTSGVDHEDRKSASGVDGEGGNQLPPRPEACFPLDRKPASGLTGNQLPTNYSTSTQRTTHSSTDISDEYEGGSAAANGGRVLLNFETMHRLPSRWLRDYRVEIVSEVRKAFSNPEQQSLADWVCFVGVKLATAHPEDESRIHHEMNAAA